MKKMKLEKVKLDDSEILTTTQMSNVIGGGWTTNTSQTYIGAEGDCYSSCDSYGSDVCQSTDSSLAWSWCNSGSNP